MTNTIEITSLQNELIKSTVKLQDTKNRKKSGLIFVDGDKTLLGLINDGVEFEYLFLKKLSTVKTPNTIMGVIKEPKINKEDFINLKRIALIENIKDAGNLGTIIRSAAAFSIEGIILFDDCVDLYNTKVIRSAAQNIFKLPILRTNDIEFIKKLKKNHELISTVVKDGQDLTKYGFKKPFILALGSEADGLSDKIINISDKKLTLFMDNSVESINLGVCASIAFFQIKVNS